MAELLCVWFVCIYSFCQLCHLKSNDKNVSNEVRVLDLNNFKLTKTDSVTMTVEEKSLLENLKLAIKENFLLKKGPFN